MSGSYLGPIYSQKYIEENLKKIGAKYYVVNDNELIEQTAESIKNGNAVGWFQDRMEFGPRALGNRSIIADPRSPTMQKTLNLKVKYRESFRPFAPSILIEDVNKWFKINEESPYMLLVVKMLENKRIKMTQEEQKLFGIDKLNIKRSEIPAVTHVDYSARIHTVDKKINPKFHSLLKKFKEKTNCPILINTSFNVRGEPIVNTPEEAFNCFMGTELDKLIIGNCILDKTNQEKSLIKNYKNNFALD